MLIHLNYSDFDFSFIHSDLGTRENLGQRVTGDGAEAELESAPMAGMTTKLILNRNKKDEKKKKKK